ncbi:MAG: YIP1 family protein [Krumholzibacteria bacterium]|nr:YIP1 family protein [Candidatus Krumholzibacteria bacterium]
MQNSDGLQDDFGPGSPEELSLPPWEQRETYGFLNGLYLSIKGVLLAPGQFFRRMPTRLGLAQPLFFAVVLGVAAAFFSWMWTLTGSSMQVLLQENLKEAVRAPIYSFFGFLFSPVLVAIGVALKAGIIHLALMVVGGNRLGFEATFRVAAYGEATSILALLPFCGSVIGTLWAVVVTVIGLYSIHATEPWKAVVAVLAPTLLCLAATGGALSLLLIGLN